MSLFECSGKAKTVLEVTSVRCPKHSNYNAEQSEPRTQRGTSGVSGLGSDVSTPQKAAAYSADSVRGSVARRPAARMSAQKNNELRDIARVDCQTGDIGGRRR